MDLPLEIGTIAWKTSSLTCGLEDFCRYFQHCIEKALAASRRLLKTYWVQIFTSMSELEGTDDGGGRTQEGGTGAALCWRGQYPPLLLVLHCWRGLSFCHHQPRSPARGHHRQPQSEKFNIQIFQTNKQYLCLWQISSKRCQFWH